MTLSRKRWPELLRGNEKLVRNLFWSFLGVGLPGIVAVATIPTLLQQIGLARFGVLSLAWIVVGYFSLFDLGLGRAMTQIVARKIGARDENQIPSIVWLCLTLMALLGVVGGLFLAAVSPRLVASRLGLPDELKNETLVTFYILAFSVPVVILSTGLRGLLEARQRFDMVNYVKIPLGILTYLAPLAVLPFSASLPLVVSSLVVSRILGFVAYAGVCIRLYPEIVRSKRFSSRHLAETLSFGGWMTVSNIVGPLLLYIGRFVLAAIVSVEAVAYFSASYDVVINLLIIPNTFVSVFFPMFAVHAASNVLESRRHYHQAVVLNLLIMIPLCFISFVAAKPALALWISPAFAEQSYVIAKWLVAGVLINSIGLIAQAFIQALGRPDLTAKLHVAELIAYLPYLWFFVHLQGADGAAFAWVIRVSISTAALLWIARVCLARLRQTENERIAQL